MNFSTFNSAYFKEGPTEQFQIFLISLVKLLLDPLSLYDSFRLPAPTNFFQTRSTTSVEWSILRLFY